MGISGLYSQIVGLDVWQTQALAKCKLVIDGQAFMYSVLRFCSRFFPDAVFNHELLRGSSLCRRVFVHTCHEILRLLKESCEIAAVVFDGMLEPLKETTNTRRRKSERLSVYNYCERYKAEHKKSKPSYLGAGFTYCPVWLPRACFDCVNALGLNVSMAAKEADDVVVKLACQYEALVLSEDSDNFCCEIPKGYLPLRNIWPQFCRNIRKASSQTELLALITKFLCEEWKPEPTTQVRCFMWGKFLKNLARFRRPRCGVPIGQLVPWLPYWMGDDYNETRVVGLRQAWDAVVSNHESAHRRHRVPMHPQQNTKEGTLIAPNGDVSAGRLRRRTKKRKGNKKSKKKRKLCKSRGTTSVGAAQTIVNSHEPETASTSASTQFGCDSDSIPTNITTTSSSTIPSTKATTTTPTVAAAQPTVSGCALGDKAHPPMQRPLAVDWSVAARRCHMGWRGPRSDSGAAVGGGGDEGMCGDEALVARLAGLLASEHAAGRLSSLLLSAAASRMVWLRILPDCLVSNMSAWVTTKVVRTLGYSLLLGPSVEGLPVEHMFCEKFGRCGYGPSQPCARLTQLCGQMLRHIEVADSEKQNATMSTSAAKALTREPNDMPPLPCTAADDDSDGGVRALLVELVRSLSALCNSKLTLSNMSHTSASPAHKLANKHLFDSVLATVKRLYLHLAAEHDRAGDVPTGGPESVLREAKKITDARSRVASPKWSLAALEASALWQALSTSICMLWDALRVTRCVTRGCFSIEHDLGLASVLDKHACR